MFKYNIILCLSMLYCGTILLLTWCFVYQKIKFNIQNMVAFGTGCLVALIFFDLLPHSYVNSVWFLSLIFMILGFLVNMSTELWILPRIHFLDYLLPAQSHDCHQHDEEHIHHHLLPSSVGCSVIPCFILCAFFDGARLSSTLLIDLHTSVLVSLGLLFHILPESIAVLGIGMASRFSRKNLLIIISVFCLSFLAGSYSFFFISYLHDLEQFILPFACGLFIYMCGIHLIPMAVISTNTKKWFFIGLLVLSALSFILKFFLHLDVH